MFLKLIVLILVCGSSGVGLLSVRQSRLQAAHEMAEARHRVRILKEQSDELRAQIALASSPDVVAKLLAELELIDQYEPMTHRIASYHGSADNHLRGVEPRQWVGDEVTDVSDLETHHNDVIIGGLYRSNNLVEDDQAHTPLTASHEQSVWTLSDGSRVIVRDSDDSQ